MINCNNMKKIYYFLFLLIGTLSMTSCLNDDTVYEDYEAWRLENEAFYTQMQDSIDPETEAPYYKEIVAENYPAYKVLYHVITEGAADGKKPYYNSTVEVKYRGHLYNTTVPFDSTKTGSTAQFAVNQVISGWTWALQNMTVGSKWEIVIPWQLAYGANGSTSGGVYIIPPYSTLVFDVELVSIPKWETGTNSSTSES